MTVMKSVLLSRRDVDFLLFEWLRVDELTKRQRFAEHSRETFAGVLDLCEQLAERYFAPHNKTSDANEPTFDGETVTVIPEVKKAWDAVAEAWHTEEPDRIERELATYAASHHDAHLAKYTLACLHAAHDDPDAAGLFRAAATRLALWWRDDG